MKCENKYCFKVFPPKVSHMAIFTLFHLPLSTSDKKALQNSRVEESQHYHMKDKWTVESITPSKEGREGEERQGRKEGGRERFAPLSADWLCVGDMQSFVCGSVTPSCLTLCDPMDCSTPGFPVLHHLLELAQTHVHGVSDAFKA